MVSCSVIGCKSRTERCEPNVSFHTFPLNDDTRQQWILATGRQNWNPTKYSRICSKHFEAHSFRKKLTRVFVIKTATPNLFVHDPNSTNVLDAINSTVRTGRVCGQKRKLQEANAFSVLQDENSPPKRRNIQNTEQVEEQVMQDSIPNTSCTLQNTLTAGDIPCTKVIKELDAYSILQDKRSTSNKQETRKKSLITPRKQILQDKSSALNEQETQNESPITPRKQKLIKKLNQKTLLAETRRKKLAAIRIKCRRLEKKNAELSAVVETLQTKRYINQEAADLLSEINPQDTQYLKKNKSKFSPEVRKFALNLHFISPKAYNFVRKTFNTCLPHTRTLTRWYQTVKGEPGFSTESLATLKLLAQHTSRKLICGLCFDEMAIRTAVEWNGQNYVGFVSCANQNIKSDVLPVAKEVLVFMLTCLNGSWKLPVGYFLTNGVSAEQKASLVKMCIDLISESGLEVASVTFDGHPSNMSMAKLLGCQLTGDIINPVFSHKGQKIVIFPDPCHMLKLVRNTLGDKFYLKNAEGKTISWEYIKLLVELQEKEGFHLGNKLRNTHVNYKKQIMKVKLASQLFSESVANALEFCGVNLELEQFKHCDATVEFIRNFNNLFDILNSRNLKANGYKKPLTCTNFENVKQFINSMFVYIRSLKMGTVNILDSNRKTGFIGFMTCMKSLLQLYEDYVKSEKLSFLMTYKLSQDHLEIFFSAVRAKGGFNNNPTATQFQAAYKRLLVHGELKHLTTGNCVPLTDINILTCTKPEIEINNTTNHSRLIEDDSNLQLSLDSEVVVSSDHDYIADPARLTEFAKHVVTYIAGFVIKALETQIKCEQCLSLLASPEKLENTLQYKKDKGGLHYPSKGVIKLCQVAEEVYKKNRLFDKRDPMHFLLSECLKKCIGLDLFADSHDHYSLIIKAICKKYLNVRIHYATKMMNKKESIRKVYTKLILFKGQ